MNKALKGCLGIVGGIMVLATCGAIMDGVSNKASHATQKVRYTSTVAVTVTVATLTAIVKPVAIATPTEVECKAKFYDDISSVLKHWSEVHSLKALDAVISEYDTGVELPYGCGDDKLLDDIDATVRIGLGMHRTAFMTKPAKVEAYLNASYEAQMKAESMMREYMR